MKYLVVYKNDKLQCQTFSVPHLLNDLEREHIDIKEVMPQGNEIARIQADDYIYTVYNDVKMDQPQ